MSNYLRRHHLGLVAIFIALSDTAVAAFDPVGSDGDIDACVDKKTKQLTLAKQNCKKGTKAVSWSATGPAGPAGATGPQGETGPQGATGAAGTARGYGLVQPSGFLSNSRNATVSHPATGVYCVAVTGASPATDVILVSAGSESGRHTPTITYLERGLYVRRALTRTVSRRSGRRSDPVGSG